MKKLVFLSVIAFAAAAFAGELKVGFATEELSTVVADEIRDAIVKATGIERDAILLHSSHTHDGGNLRRRGKGAVDDIYISMAVTRAVDAAGRRIERTQA